jgi:predicted dehydrogenase
MPIKVGLIGYGNAAKTFHIPFITAIHEYELIAILQRAEAPADPASIPPGTHCTVDIPGIRHYRTADEFFADSEIDLVVVATHHDTHAMFAERALVRGMHGLFQLSFSIAWFRTWDSFAELARI